MGCGFDHIVSVVNEVRVYVSGDSGPYGCPEEGWSRHE